MPAYGPHKANLAKAKRGVGKSTQNVSVPVNTKSLTTPSGPGLGSNKKVPRPGK